MLAARPPSRKIRPRTGAAVVRIQCLLLVVFLSPTRSTAASFGLVFLIDCCGETTVVPVRPPGSMDAWTRRTSSSLSSKAAFGTAVPRKNTRRDRRRRHGSSLQLGSRSWGHLGLHRLHSSWSLSSTSRSSHDVGVTSPAEDRLRSSMVTNETFEEMFGGEMPHWLLSRVRECGWTHPTPVQAESLRSVLRQNVTDLVLQAETGSGKTLAYLLPCLSRIDPTRSSLQAAVVVPTRELGLQVAKVARRLAAGYYSAASPSDDSDDNDGPNNNNKKKILVMSVLQGSHHKRQRAWAWADPPHVVIGTPPELLDMVARGGFKRFNSIRTLVVDEVDACLLHNMGSVAVAAPGSAPSSSSSSSSSPGTGASIQLAGTTLHELLSKHLSPTFVEGRTNGIVGSNGDGAMTRRPVDRSRVTIFCSATIPQPRHFVRQCVQNQWMLNEPVHLRCRPLPERREERDDDDNESEGGDRDGDHDMQPPSSMMPSSLEHQYVVCADADQQFATLRRLLQRIHKSGIGSHNNDDRKKLLIFCDPRRLMRDMADIIGRDLERISSEAAAGHGSDDESSTVPSTSSRSTRTRTSRAVVSVLNLEDNLSDRAAAMSAFRGDDDEYYDSDPAGTNDEHDDDEGWVDGKDEGGDSAGALDSSHSPPPADAPAVTTTTRILLSTDLAARGLDIVDITHVVHYDLPVNADAYVHRSGRAGRFGRPGRVLSIVPPQQEFALGRLLNKLRVRATCVGRQQPRQHQQPQPRKGRGST